MSKPAITQRHKVALQTAVNGILGQCALLEKPRAYITATDAGIAFSAAALLMQVADVEAQSKEPGTVDLAAVQTSGSMAPTIASNAVANALADAGAEIIAAPANDAGKADKAA